MSLVLKLAAILALVTLSACASSVAETADAGPSFAECQSRTVQLHVVSPQLGQRGREAVEKAAKKWSQALQGCVEVKVMATDASPVECAFSWQPGVMPEDDKDAFAFVEGLTATIGEETFRDRGVVSREQMLDAVVLHEMGHSLGLGDVTDRAEIASVMWHVVQPGMEISKHDVRRALSARGCR